MEKDEAVRRMEVVDKRITLSPKFFVQLLSERARALGVTGLSKRFRKKEKERGRKHKRKKEEMFHVRLF